MNWVAPRGRRRCPACATAALVLGEPFLVVVEIFLVVDDQAGGGLERRDEAVRHIQRQLEMRSLPVAGSRRLTVWPARSTSSTCFRAATRSQERRAQDQAAAGAPPPMKRRREASRARIWGSISLAIAVLPFVKRGKPEGQVVEQAGVQRATSQESSSISSRSSVVGMSAAGSTSEASGDQQTYTSSPAAAWAGLFGADVARTGESSSAARDSRSTDPGT